jgi:hypothetical protein
MKKALPYSVYFFLIFFAIYLMYLTEVQKTTLELMAVMYILMALALFPISIIGFSIAYYIVHIKKFSWARFLPEVVCVILSSIFLYHFSQQIVAFLVKYT